MVMKEFKRIQQVKDGQVGEHHVVMPEEAKKKKNVHEIFRRYDVDGSDSLDLSELLSVLNDLNIPMNPKDVDELYDELDEDGSGSIEFDEFYSCM